MELAVVEGQKTLDDLCQDLVGVQAQIAELNQAADAIKNEIAEKVGTKDEGAFSVECDQFKVTTNQPINRTINPESARDVQQRIPKDIADGIFTWKPSLSVKLYRELEKHQPAIYREVSRAVTAKPGKVSVKVEALS